VAAFGSPVVPLLYNLVAAVVFAVFSSSNLAQSFSPCCIRLSQLLNPSGTACFKMSKMNMLDVGIEHSSAAARIAGSISGSVMRNFVLLVLMWCSSSKGV
jgi:hypothetical protein